MNRIAVIPARGGSKRIPDKNIRSFAGRPMIHHVIGAARDSGLFNRIIVSTDSAAIADIAVAGGAEAPFRRSDGNSDDHAPLAAAVTETLAQLEKQHERPTHVCCLLATAVLLKPRFLVESWRMLEEQELDAVTSVQRFHYPIQRALRRNKDGLLEMMWPEFRLSRSQDLEPAWHDAGQFYWITREALVQHGRLIAGRAGGYTLGPLDAVDIDTPDDWRLAERLHALGSPNETQPGPTD